MLISAAANGVLCAHEGSHPFLSEVTPREWGWAEGCKPVGRVGDIEGRHSGHKAELWIMSRPATTWPSDSGWVPSSVPLFESKIFVTLNREA